MRRPASTGAILSTSRARGRYGGTVAKQPGLQSFPSPSFPQSFQIGPLPFAPFPFSFSPGARRRSGLTAAQQGNMLCSASEVFLCHPKGPGANEEAGPNGVSPCRSTLQCRRLPSPDRQTISTLIGRRLKRRAPCGGSAAVFSTSALFASRHGPLALRRAWPSVYSGAAQSWTALRRKAPTRARRRRPE